MNANTLDLLKLLGYSDAEVDPFTRNGPIGELRLQRLICQSPKVRSEQDA